MCETLGLFGLTLSKIKEPWDKIRITFGEMKKILQQQNTVLRSRNPSYGVYYRLHNVAGNLVYE